MGRVEEIEKRIRQKLIRALWVGVAFGLLLGFAFGFFVGYGQVGTTVVIPLSEGIRT